MRIDPAYTSRKNRAHLRRRGIRLHHPGRRANGRKERGSRGGLPSASDPKAYKPWQAVRCGINRMTRHRAMATRHDKLTVG